MSLTLTSPAFGMNGIIPQRFTCDGENISPELTFSNIPENTKSLVLIVDDPDVPREIKPDGLWNHWLVWNIPANTRRVGEGSIPPGIVGANARGHIGYRGPCPPDREHRYFFTLYAVDMMLSLPEGSTRVDLLNSLDGHIIEQTELVGRYNRTNS